MASPTINLNDSLPAAPTNGINGKWQSVASTHTGGPINATVAVVGPGGTTLFLRADGTWSAPSTGSTGIPTPATRQVFIVALASQTSFANNTTTGNFGASLATVTGGATVRVVPTSTQTGGNKNSSSSSAGSSGGFYESSPNVCLGTFRKLVIKAGMDSTTNIRWWVGMGVTVSTFATYRADLPADNFFGFRFSTAASDTHIKAYVGTDATHQTIVDTGIAADTAVHIYEVDWDGTSFTFYIDNVLVATIATNIPAASSVMSGAMMADNVGTSNSRTVSGYAFYYEAL